MTEEVSDIFKGVGVEIRLKKPENFLVIKETLTRIGIASKKDNTLYQSCHILHKQGRYAVMHFKELFLLDGKETDFSDEDRSRRNTITNLLAEWGLYDIIDPTKTAAPLAPMNKIKIVPFKDKKDWTLAVKYTIGGKKA